MGSLQSKSINSITVEGLHLRRVGSNLTITLAVATVILFFPTFSFSLWTFLLYYLIKTPLTKTCTVKNMKTGEKFKMLKSEYREYSNELKKQMKSKENKVHSLDELKTRERIELMDKKAEMLSEITKNTTKK